jgi:hypothetical protein
MRARLSTINFSLQGIQRPDRLTERVKSNAIHIFAFGSVKYI